MIFYMVGKLAPNFNSFRQGLFKYVPGKGYFCAVSSQNGDKFATSFTAPIVERLLGVEELHTSRGYMVGQEVSSFYNYLDYQACV